MKHWRAACSALLAALLLLGIPRIAFADPQVTLYRYTVVSTVPPNPGAGWDTVTQYLTNSGCAGSSCGSSWRPSNSAYEVLLEHAGHRVFRSHSQGDGTAPNMGQVVYARERCPTDHMWAAGIWHHNFLAQSQLIETHRQVTEDGTTRHIAVTLTQQWRSGYYQSFAHNDDCFTTPAASPTVPPILSPSSVLPTAEPPNNSTPIPTAPAAATVQVQVRVVLQGIPPTSGSAHGTGAGTYRVGESVRATAAYPSVWDQSAAWDGITFSGCAISGNTWETIFPVPSTDCTLTFIIRFRESGTPLPGSTPLPQPTPVPPCFQQQGLPSAMPLTVTPGTTTAWVSPLLNAVNAPPPLPASYVPGQVPSGTLTLTLHPEQTGVQGKPGRSIFGAWASAAAKFNLTLIDLGVDSGTADAVTLVRIDTVEAQRPMRDGAPTSDRGQRLTAWTLDSSITVRGPITWHLYTTDHQAGWYEQVYWMHDPARTGRSDRRWPAITPDLAIGRGWIRDPAPLVFQFTPQAGHQYAVHVETLKKSCGQWFSIWTMARFGTRPTISAPQVTIWGRARPVDDTVAAWHTTQHNADPLRFTWPYGEMLAFAPDADLQFALSPDLVAYGYHVEWRIDGWTFHGSSSSPSVTVSRAPRVPVQVVWSKFPPSELRPPTVFAYRLDQLGDQQLAVTVQYTYTLVDMTGTRVGEPVTASAPATFTVALIAPHIERRGTP